MSEQSPEISTPFDREGLIDAYRKFENRPLTPSSAAGAEVSGRGDAALWVAAPLDRPFSRVKHSILNAERFQKQFLIGPGGCGKSTLLNRLAADDDLSQRYHMVRMSFLDDLNPMDATAADALFAVYMRLIRSLSGSQLNDALGDFEKLVAPVTHHYDMEPEGKALLDAYSARLQTDVHFRRYLREHLAAAQDNLQTRMDAICERFSRHTFDCYKLTDEALRALRSEDVSDAILSRLDGLRDHEYKNEVRFLRVLEDAIGNVHLRYYKALFLKHAWREEPIDVLILADDLEKLRRNLLERMITDESHLLLMPAVKIVSILPIDLFYEPAFARVRDRFDCDFIRAVALSDSADAPIPLHRDWLTDVAARRIPAELTTDETLSAAVAASGGLMRALNVLMQCACTRAIDTGAPVLDLNLFREAAQSVYDRYATIGNAAEYKSEMDAIARNKNVAGVPPKRLIYLLRYGFVQEYADEEDTLWYDVHPWFKGAMIGE